MVFVMTKIFVLLKQCYGHFSLNFASHGLFCQPPPPQILLRLKKENIHGKLHFYLYMNIHFNENTIYIISCGSIFFHVTEGSNYFPATAWLHTHYEPTVRTYE